MRSVWQKVLNLLILSEGCLPRQFSRLCELGLRNLNDNHCPVDGAILFAGFTANAARLVNYIIAVLKIVIDAMLFAKMSA